MSFFPGFTSDRGISKKEWLKAKCLDLIFGWECSPCWHRFARIVELFIMDAFIDLFITLCIVINTAFMAIDHYGMDKQLTETLRIGNYVSIKDCGAHDVSPLISVSLCLSVRSD